MCLEKLAEDFYHQIFSLYLHIFNKSMRNFTFC